ncbi:MAG: hypothetical protein U1E76_14225 [Planctomycetota bacterium]
MIAGCSRRKLAWLACAALLLAAAWPAAPGLRSTPRPADQPLGHGQELAPLHHQLGGELPPGESVSVGSMPGSPLDQAAPRQIALVGGERIGPAIILPDLARRPAQPAHLLAHLFTLHLDPGAE